MIDGTTWRRTTYSVVLLSVWTLVPLENFMLFVFIEVQVRPNVYTPSWTLPTFQIIMLFRKVHILFSAFFSWVKKTLWTQELLKRHLLLWTLSNQSMLKLVRELINHLSLQVQVLNDEPIGSAELTSKTRNLCANYTNTQVVMCTSTTSVTVHKWSIHSSRDNPHSGSSLKGQSA